MAAEPEVAPSVMAANLDVSATMSWTWNHYGANSDAHADKFYSGVKCMGLWAHTDTWQPPPPPSRGRECLVRKLQTTCFICCRRLSRMFSPLRAWCRGSGATWAKHLDVYWAKECFKSKQSVVYRPGQARWLRYKKIQQAVGGTQDFGKIQ